MYVETEINKQNERMKNDGWIHLLPVFGCMHGVLYMLGIRSDRMDDHELRWVSVSRPADAQEPSPRRRKPNWRVTGPEWVK